ncbi:hypothetical protein [Thioalkalivibrio sp. ALE6]|uniref:phage tail tube protein n=1 Tax=Thioalkalivibrio sp. ALE6 TaxID=1266908 RepID=UPI0003633176|nr:hypothetical protein [Thioalkalivibrio sp. ALE6]
MGMTNGGKIFRGDVRLNVELPDGSMTGYLPAQNAQAFQINVPEAETTDRISKMRDTAGQVLDSVSEIQPHELSITFDGFNGHLLASAFNGALANYTSDAKTGETVQITARHGAGVSVGSYEISNVEVAADDNGEPAATPLVEGTDYEVEHRLGMIRALEGGAILDGDPVHVTFDAAEVTGDMIRGAARSEIRAELIFDGIDTVTNDPVIMEFDRVILSGSGEFDFLSDEFNTVDVGGRTITVEGKDEPYRIRFPSAS